MKRTLVSLAALMLVGLPSAGLALANDARLPAGVLSILNRQVPGWRLAVPDADVIAYCKREWGLGEDNLAVLRGDFDGNGRTDFALHVLCGTGHKERRLLVFRRVGRGYRIHTLVSGEPYGQYYLLLARRGTKWVDHATSRPVRFRYDTIQLNNFEKSGGSFVYRNGSFRRIATSD